MSNYFLLSLQVEAGLLIGNMDAATDILSLEGHRISHIVTVSIPIFYFIFDGHHIYHLSHSLLRRGFRILYFIFEGQEAEF